MANVVSSLGGFASQGHKDKLSDAGHSSGLPDAWENGDFQSAWWNQGASAE